MASRDRVHDDDSNGLIDTGQFMSSGNSMDLDRAGSAGSISTTRSAPGDTGNAGDLDRTTTSPEVTGSADAGRSAESTGPVDRDNDLEKYRLDEPTLESIFQKQVLPHLLESDPEVRHTPEALLIGGQPGAGKTAAQHDIARKFAERGGIIQITGDDLRRYHPTYTQLVDSDDMAMVPATAQASGRWVERSIDWVGKSQHNLLIEGTFRRPDVTIATAEGLARDGYKVQIVALAVPAVDSRLSCVERYVGERNESGSARWTELSSHDAGYHGSVEVLRQAHASSAVNQIKVQSRDGIIYNNERDSEGKWRSQASPADVLATARTDLISSIDQAERWTRLSHVIAQLERLEVKGEGVNQMVDAVEDDLRRIDTEIEQRRKDDGEAR